MQHARPLADVQQAAPCAGGRGPVFRHAICLMRGHPGAGIEALQGRSSIRGGAEQFQQLPELVAAFSRYGGLFKAFDLVTSGSQQPANIQHVRQRQIFPLPTRQNYRIRARIHIEGRHLAGPGPFRGGKRHQFGAAGEIEAETLPCAGLAHGIQQIENTLLAAVPQFMLLIAPPPAFQRLSENAPVRLHSRRYNAMYAGRFRAGQACRQHRWKQLTGNKGNLMSVTGKGHTGLLYL